MAKETTYQRLKRENENLRNELFIVCKYPERLDAKAIVLRERILSNIEDTIWQGTNTNDKASFTGFLNMLKAHDI